MIARAEVARAVEQELTRVMVKCLTAGVVADLPGFRDLRVPVMRQFERVLEENRGRPLYMVEICAAIGVCDRMLRLRCTEELGISTTPLSLVAADAYGSPRAGPGGSRHDDRDGSRDQPGVRRDWPVFRRLSKLFGETPSTTLRRMQDASPSMTVAAPAPYRLASFI